MLNLRRCVVGVVAVLLVSGVALAQTSETAFIAELRAKANAGDANAQFNLGVMYYTGLGVPQDYVEAHKWRNLAASRASAENQTRYAETRDAVATLMTPAQIAEAQTLASEWQAAFDARQE